MRFRFKVGLLNLSNFVFNYDFSFQQLWKQDNRDEKIVVPRAVPQHASCFVLWIQRTPFLYPLHQTVMFTPPTPPQLLGREVGVCSLLRAALHPAAHCGSSFLSSYALQYFEPISCQKNAENDRCLVFKCIDDEMMVCAKLTDTLQDYFIIKVNSCFAC